MIKLYTQQMRDGVVTYEEVPVKEVSEDISAAAIADRGVLLIIGGVRHGIPFEQAAKLPAAIQEALDAARPPVS